MRDPSYRHPLTKVRSAFLIRAALLLLASCSLSAHTTYLRPLDYNPGPGENFEILVFNGTFDESVQDPPVETVNMLMKSGPSGISDIEKQTWHNREDVSSAWRRWNSFKYRLGGLDQRRTSIIDFQSEEEGTHVIGVQFYPGRLAMDLPKFAEYLEEVGLQDEPISKFKATEPNAIIREQWTKTAKTILEIGDGHGGDVTRPLGLSAEIVPLEHPRTVNPGEVFRVRLLIMGEPLANQVVLAGREQGFAGSGRGEHISLRSNADGIAEIRITEAGEWWIGYNRMLHAKPGQEVDLVTFWTTLTFKIE